MFILFPLMLGILINLNLDLYNHIGFRQDKPYLETILDILISIVAPYHNVEKTIMLCIIVVITIPFPTAWVIMKRRENAENDNYREWLNIVKSIFVILPVLVMHTIYITLVVSVIGMAILYAMTAIGDILYNITSINLNEIIISLTRNKLDNHNSILIMLTPSVFIAVVFALTAIFMSLMLIIPISIKENLGPLETTRRMWEILTADLRGIFFDLLKHTLTLVGLILAGLSITTVSDILISSIYVYVFHLDGFDMLLLIGSILHHAILVLMFTTVYIYHHSFTVSYYDTVVVRTADDELEQKLTLMVNELKVERKEYSIDELRQRLMREYRETNAN